jgi:PAS domain S-box-containing protein
MDRFKFIRDLSIKNKIVAIIFFVTFAVVSIGFGFISFKDIKRLKNETRSNLLLNAKLIGDYCIIPFAFENRQQADEALSRLRHIESVDEGYLFDGSGNLFATFPDSIEDPLSAVTDLNQSAIYKDGFFYITEPISFEGEIIGALYIKANSELLKKENERLVLILSTVFVLMLILSYFLASRLQKIFTKPILLLAETAVKISESQDFSIKLIPRGKDEVGFLYRQFNLLMAQLLKWKNERDEAEKDISFLAQVLRNINEFVSITDLNDNIIFINQSFIKTYGYSKEELVGKNIKMVRSSNNSPELVNEILSATLKGGWTGEMMNRRKDGTEFPILLFTTIILDNDDQAVALVGISIDITDRKKADEELQLHRHHLEELVIQRTADLEAEKIKAQSADRLKSAFLATMSHELRTPLNSIIGFTGILMLEYPGPLNNEQKKQLGMAQNSARHLLSLINDVLDISKIEAEQLKLNYDQFNLPVLIQKIAETNKPFADKKNLKIEVSIAADVTDMVSDKLRVHQIILNLFNNAIKFTENGFVGIKCFLVDHSVRIQIIDSGIGIEKEKLELLFKPFMQIDTGLTRKHEGTGLGLSISKKLTEMLNGEIDVESTIGKGSVFTVSLPINNTK